MAFLTQAELKTKSVISVINMITQNDPDIVETIIEESIDLMKSYLFNYYDVALIFDTEDTDRSNVILKYLKAIVVYEIYASDPQNEMNEVVKLQYDEAMLWLTKVAKGDINLDLPRNIIDDEAEEFLHLNYGKRYSSDY